MNESCSCCCFFEPHYDLVQNVHRRYKNKGYSGEKKSLKLLPNNSFPQFFHWDPTFTSNITELPHFLHCNNCGSRIIERILTPKLFSQHILNTCHFENNSHSTSSSHSGTRWGRSEHHLCCPKISLRSAIQLLKMLSY